MSKTKRAGMTVRPRLSASDLALQLRTNRQVQPHPEQVGHTQ